MTHPDFRRRVLRELGARPRTIAEVGQRIAPVNDAFEQRLLYREVALACDLLVLRGRARKTAEMSYVRTNPGPASRSISYRHHKPVGSPGRHRLRAIPLAAALALSACATPAPTRSYFGPSGLPYPPYAKLEQFQEQDSPVFRYCTDDCPQPTAKIAVPNSWNPVARVAPIKPAEFVTPEKPPVTEITPPISNHQVTMTAPQPEAPVAPAPSPSATPVAPRGAKTAPAAAVVTPIRMAPVVKTVAGPAPIAAARPAAPATAVTVQVATASQVRSIAPEVAVQTVDVGAAIKAAAGDDAAAESLAEVRETLDRWAASWSARDTEAYNALYDAGFKPENGMATRDWLDRRTAVIKQARHIDVEVKIVTIRQRNSAVSVDFWQRYTSNSFKSRVLKSVDLVRSGDRWLIRAERVVMKGGMTA